jgi:hypothetical protein
MTLRVATLILLLTYSIFSQDQPQPGQKGLKAPGVVRCGDQPKTLGCDAYVKQHPNYYTATSQAWVQHGDQIRNDGWPPCESGTDSANQLKTLAKTVALAANVHPALKAAAIILSGPVIDNLESYAKQSGGDIGFILFPNRKATCKPVAVALPVGARIIEIAYFYGDGDAGSGACVPEGHGWVVCKCGYSGWEATQKNRVIGPKDRVVGAVFKNWSHDRARWASIVVTFDPPPGWKPDIHQLPNVAYQ